MAPSDRGPKVAGQATRHTALAMLRGALVAGVVVGVNAAAVSAVAAGLKGLWGSLLGLLMVVMVVSALVVLRIGFYAVPVLDQMSSTTGQFALVGMILFATGFVLGCAFPLGVRAVAPTGEWAIQKMWAVNGAASIVASVLAAVIGLIWGSGSVLTAGILAYVLALATTVFSNRPS